MSVELKTPLGKIDVENEVIAMIAGGAAEDCYGLVGMASRNSLKDGVAELLGKENLGRGVTVRENGELVEIDLYVIVNYGVKISEVAHNVQSTVKYTLEQSLGLQVGAINVYVQGVRVTES
ncbi:Asp23/Gls24 family envelope stress response protein [Ammoniphilus resinae]|uniref:Alkaline shock family protein YloU n=1 Tax=Ammoniphilus resinae TaxID=861532 RepID=A0ABS4GKD8_9BACL|nr:Asp23/Gls24 family envelope stress response protein [Ammoniphilus resinae]MBP1930731.1 putative alkaline shock family protein YloU [Ammoniphilus resinae]